MIFYFFIDVEINVSLAFIDIEIPAPLGCLLTYHMATPAGYAAFLKENRVSQLFKDILDEYGIWLSSPGSCTSLVSNIPGGWFTEEALDAMPGFNDLFECDPTKEYHGFSSFDAFFTRRFRNGMRPVDDVDNSFVVVNACENTPLNINRDVKRLDTFWTKKMPYSLQYILDGDPNIEKFVGGTVFQGFLSLHTYHRFHAPVSGRIVTSRVVQGTAFSQPFHLKIIQRNTWIHNLT